MTVALASDWNTEQWSSFNIQNIKLKLSCRLKQISNPVTFTLLVAKDISLNTMNSQ